ncbi:MAG: phosphocholine cytidylyltransferase family protein [Betaproteobacteria bacterium]
MRAILLAAGRGLRLQQSIGEQFPKCLLRFDGVTLLERHLRILNQAGVAQMVLALGFQSEQVEDELDRVARRLHLEVVLNPHWELGSVLTVHAAAEPLTRGGDVLLMDADVLYDQRIVTALTEGDNADRLLIDRDFEAGDEPVKVCVRNGVPVELRKQLPVDLQYDLIGESVGFFRFRENTARRLAEIVAHYVETGRSNMPHEEAVRDLLLEGGHRFDIADVTGAPWIEIDFPNDVDRARDEILPQLQPLGAMR